MRHTWWISGDIMILHHIRKDDSGVSAVVEYILTFLIASIIFSIMLLISYSMFIEGPQKSVKTLRYTDVGNDMTAKIIEHTHCSRDGTILTSFDMPSSIASKGYSVSVEKNGWDREVLVSSESGDYLKAIYYLCTFLLSLCIIGHFLRYNKSKLAALGFSLLNYSTMLNF